MPYEAQVINNDALSEFSVKKNVLPHYGLEYSDITQVKFKDTDKQRAVYKVEYQDKTYCLKKVYFDKEELLFVYSAIEWLYRNGIHVPRILPTLDKGRFVDTDGMLFILTPWIDGTKCSYDNIDNVLDASSVLSALHNSTEKFTPIPGSKNRIGFEDLYTSTQKHFNQLLNCSNLAFKYKDKFSKTFLNYFDSNISLAETSVKISSTINSSNLRTSLCHMDYVNKNIIFDERNDLWIIDFDKCRIDYCVHDISYFLRRLLKRENTKWDLEMTIKLLDIYEKIRPLNIDEYKYILVYLSFPQKYWKISRDYYNNINKCNKNSFQILLNKSVEKTEYHTKFIEEFKSYVENKFNKEIS